MKLLRVLAIIVTSPIWLLAGFFVVGVCVPLWIAITIGRICEWGFKGEWD